MKKFLSLCFFTLGLSLAGGAQAQMKPEDAIKLRKSAFALIGYNFGSLAAMAQDKKPFNAQEAARNGASLKALASMPWEFFGPGTDKGDTKALPAIWTENARYNKLAGDAGDALNQMASAAASGDIRQIQTAVGVTGRACKACHDDFRAK